MIKDRLRRLRNILETENIDAILLARKSNNIYATDVDYVILTLITNQDTNVYVPRLEYDRAVEELENYFNIIAYSREEIPKRRSYERLMVGKDFTRLIIEELKRINIKRIGIDIQTIDIISKFREEGIEVVNIFDKILDIRSMKTIDEVERIKKSLEITEKCFQEILELIKPEISEKKLASIIISKLIEFGADEQSFTPIVAFGENTVKPHHKYTDRILRNGDVIILDFGCKFKHYCSDFTRTLKHKSVNKKILDVHYAIIEAMNSVYKELKAGIKCVKIDEIARNVLKEYGFDEYFIHGLGHGIGIDIHENPRIAPDSDHELKNGNVITIEPGVYIPKEFGIRIEDMVLVTETGCKVLTKTSRDLFII